MENVKILELIDQAPWREAVTYRDSWPHEYIRSRDDNQRELYELVCSRFRAGEGVDGWFFSFGNTYLFLGEYKYWIMTHWDEVDLDDGQNYILNRAPLYRDRRDFVIQNGDTSKVEDYPEKPAKSNGHGGLQPQLASK